MASKERLEHSVNAPLLQFDVPAQLAKLRSEEQWRSTQSNKCRYCEPTGRGQGSVRHVEAAPCVC
jgi:hypothetical protein